MKKLLCTLLIIFSMLALASCRLGGLGGIINSGNLGGAGNILNTGNTFGEEGPTSGVIYDKSPDGTYAEVIGYNGTSNNIIIADTYEGLPVKSIYEEAFKNSFIKSVEIPDSVESIGGSAFRGCGSLASVVIGTSVTSIGRYAFYDCHSLNNIWYRGTNDGWNAITKGLSWHSGTYTVVCNYPEQGSKRLCYQLNPDSNSYAVTGMGTYNSTDVVIPDTYKGLPVTKVNNGAFSGCTSLASIVIPDSVTIIGSSALRDCDNLRSVTIPDSVISIGDYAFYSCNRLANVVIGNSVTNIGNDAFYNCTSLASIVIPDSVTVIGSSAFRDCDSLASIVIPNSVTNIGESAFNSCSKLSSVIIENPSATIGGDVFSSCSPDLYTEYEYGKYVGNKKNPYAILIGLTNKNFRTYNIHNDTEIIAYGVFNECARLTEIIIPDGVTNICTSAFRDSLNLTSVVIGESVTSIASTAFINCVSLTSVVIPDSVTSIGSSAFAHCTNLTSIVIGDSVTSIGNSAFSDCTSLTSIVIGDSVTNIDTFAFSRCYRLTSIKYRGTEEEWNAITKKLWWNDNIGNYTIIYNYNEE